MTFPAHGDLTAATRRRHDSQHARWESGSRARARSVGGGTLKGQPRSFWGKLDQQEGGGVVAWHPLVDHCADVAACCEALLQRTLLRKRLARLGGLADLSERQVARLAVFAALHDVGKFNLGFQEKCRTTDPAKTAGHVREFLVLFDGLGYRETSDARKALGLDELLAWGQEEDAGCLLVAAIGHHGRPLALDACGHHRPDIWRPRGGLDPFAGVANLRRFSEEWFPTAFEPSTSDLLPGAPAFQHAFSGLVMLADWLGSDTRFFPFSDEPDGNRIESARHNAAMAVKEMHIDPTDARTSLGTAPVQFDAIAAFSPTAVQAGLLDVPLPSAGSITVLESETGSGKTEAALASFVRLYQAGLVDGMYFALPTRTAATQIHRRVVQSMRRAFPDDTRRPPVVLAVPGYIEADDRTGMALPNFDVLWNDDGTDRFRYRAWAAERPKRYLAGAVAIGTIDQVLLSALTVGHAHLRATALLRQLLVVDEVHASDAYMDTLLAGVLDFHVGAGGHALLMSATLGSRVRAMLSNAAHISERSAALDVECTRPFPLITHGLSGGPSKSHPVAVSQRCKTIHVEICTDIGAPAKIARRALDVAARGAKVLVLRNTVADCIDTQAALESLAESRQDLLFRCVGVPAPHHSRFAKPDREALDDALDYGFGVRSSATPCIVVATQTVQQSLDIDADWLITDLCPMDVLLQRIGRLHRHARQRPTGIGEPTVTVLVPETRDLSLRLTAHGLSRGASGIGTVYDDLRIIEATWRLLEAHPVFELPGMNRELVERSTHPEALAAVVEGHGEVWRKHAARIDGQLLARTRVAKLNMVERDKHFGKYAFPPRELERRVQTRLGEADRVLDLPRFRSPFGAELSQLLLPAHLAYGAGPNETASAIECGSAEVHFNFGPKRFVYDRLGLRHATTSEPADNEETDA